MRGFYVTVSGQLSIPEFRKAMRTAAENAQRMSAIVGMVKEHFTAHKGKSPVSHASVKRLQEKLAIDAPELMVAHMGYGKAHPDTDAPYLFIRAYGADDFKMVLTPEGWSDEPDKAIAGLRANAASAHQAMESAASVVGQYNAAVQKLVSVIANVAIVPPAEGETDTIGTPVEPMFSYLGAKQLGGI